MAQLTRRDPMTWNNLARTFNEMADRMQRNWRLDPWGEESELSSTWAPMVDIYDDGDQLVVQAELPGVKKEDIDVRVEGNTLMLHGKRERENEVQGEGYYRSERHYGAFGRSFRLPSTVASDKIDASFKDGVLTIRMPKIEQARPKQIQVK